MQDSNYYTTTGSLSRIPLDMIVTALDEPGRDQLAALLHAAGYRSTGGRATRLHGLAAEVGMQAAELKLDEKEDQE
jgi:hypothetical protein